MSVSYYTADRLTAISQDPNRCECDPSKGPDTPIKHSREARLSTLTFEGAEVSGGNQSKPQIDFDSRIQFPDSRCSSQEGSTFESCLICFFGFFLVATKKISLLQPKNSVTLSHRGDKRCHRYCLSFPFFSPLSSSLPTKIKSSGAQARHFSTKLSLIFQRLLTLCTQLAAY